MQTRLECYWLPRQADGAWHAGDRVDRPRLGVAALDEADERGRGAHLKLPRRDEDRGDLPLGPRERPRQGDGHAVHGPRTAAGDGLRVPRARREQGGDQRAIQRVTHSEIRYLYLCIVNLFMCVCA